MDAEEKEICNYLKGFAGQFISGREICRRAGGKWRYRESPEWAVPFLTRLVEKKVLESDASGHYKLIKQSKKDQKGKWLSPKMKEILSSNGNFEHVISNDELNEILDDIDPK